jgi:uncharacterized protein (TIGR00297 family)
MHTPDVLILLALIAAAAASAHWKKLTPPAALTGCVIGGLVYAGCGYTGLLLLALFFLLGTVATSWKKTDKLRIKGNAAHQSTRHTGQVIANGGTAAILGALALLLPAEKPLFGLMLAASLSSATGDTLSSELGMLYGRRPFNILTGKREEKGLDGVISVEGLLIGIAGSAIIAAAWLALKGPAVWPSAFGTAAAQNLTGPPVGLSAIGSAAIIVLAGLLGNLADSLLGATLERKGLLSNDAVNFCNTAIAALCAGALTGFNVQDSTGW